MGLDNFWPAFGLTILAGLSTGIGSAIAFFTNTTNKKFLATALGFSAGVMIYVSLVEILPLAKTSITSVIDKTAGGWLTLASFVGGIFIIGIIDSLIPEVENPHEAHTVEEMDGSDAHKQAHALKRMGLFTAIAIAVHNFPEGLATFAAGLHDAKLGASIALAVAIHNIPEGIAVSVPIYYATGSRIKAFSYSFLSGLAEPIGALFGFFILRSLFNDMTMGILFAMVAGIMVFISIDELLPSSREYGGHHWSIYGFVAGMVVMAISLI